MLTPNHTLSRFAATLSAAAALLFSASFAAAGQYALRTSFAANDSDGANYQNGQSIASYSAQGWTLSGTANITNTAFVNDPANSADTQSLELNPGTTVDRSVSYTPSDDGSNSIVWVQGYFRGAGSPNAPQTPSGKASSIVHFSASNGIQMYDGTKSGTEAWVSTSSTTYRTLNPDAWYQITLRQDYAAKTWDCFVDGQKQNTAPLGFYSTDIAKLNGFTSLADVKTYIDNMAIIASARGDANGDGLFDSGDLLRVLQLVQLGASPAVDTLFGGNADVAGVAGNTTPDGIVDARDLEALQDRLMGR